MKTSDLINRLCDELENLSVNKVSPMHAIATSKLVTAVVSVKRLEIYTGSTVLTGKNDGT